MFSYIQRGVLFPPALSKISFDNTLPVREAHLKFCAFQFSPQLCSPPIFFPLNFEYFFEKFLLYYSFFTKLFQISNPSLSERHISNFAHLNLNLLYFFLQILNFRFQTYRFHFEGDNPTPKFLIFHHSISYFKTVNMIIFYSNKNCQHNFTKDQAKLN